MKITTKIENLSLEGMTLGILASFRAAIRAHYSAAVIGWSLTQAARGLGKGDELPPGAIRRGFMKMAYDEVIDLLPEDSPFREPLTAFSEGEIQSIKD